MDLNHRPPVPKTGALTRLRYTPTLKKCNLFDFFLPALFKKQSAKFLQLKLKVEKKQKNQSKATHVPQEMDPKVNKI